MQAAVVKSEGARGEGRGRLPRLHVHGKSRVFRNVVGCAGLVLDSIRGAQRSCRLAGNRPRVEYLEFLVGVFTKHRFSYTLITNLRWNICRFAGQYLIWTCARCALTDRR